MESLVFGSIIMAVAGGLIALRINYLTPKQFVPEWTFYIWIAVIIGGAGNNRGAILGGFMLALLFTLPRFLQNYLSGLPLGGILENFRLLSIGLLLIVILTFRPQGIFGEERPGEL
jgi:branched-chain amino acid transport system permease protein